jgi:beta-phosphoglucomutase-like phosphatase (HAD superfamily)
MNFDAAIFDLDGVIVDSRTPVRTAINAALERHGFPPRDPGELDRFIGPPALDAFVELTGEPQGSDRVAACVDTYHREYERLFLTQTTLIEGIVTVLEAIELPLALATANTRDNIHPVQGVQSVQNTHRFAALGHQQTHLRGAIRVEGLVDGLVRGSSSLLGRTGKPP